MTVYNPHDWEIDEPPKKKKIKYIVKKTWRFNEDPVESFINWLRRKLLKGGRK